LKYQQFSLTPGAPSGSLVGASAPRSAAARWAQETEGVQVVQARIGAWAGVGVVLILVGASPLRADGYKNCTKAPKASWQPASAAEAAATAAGYEVRKTKVEGSCYEVYGVNKQGKLFELFYDPVDLKLMHTKAK